MPVGVGRRESKKSIRARVGDIREELRLLNEAVGRGDWDAAERRATLVFEKSRGLEYAVRRKRRAAHGE
jgi:hypothetical protein